ncbi:MAG: chromate transporter [Symplocastrum torsivum CPER-KK1]|jgi:chromate transporter|uniref:Chromate transporter n=1 Tax=Symplocastrum torsivum CPER-KK1 TaxID=450513 RepID=A0A951PJB9_9CYAN|nr:chromate transporter [Microcoleus sp. FACHB-SPT15]MBD1807403.1 chromate transporter [Microcoleus sp. FACHB-SPT15]MBW4544773.1 chromate transporter [Symplocastrum torsivum CPER-KK1]
MHLQHKINSPPLRVLILLFAKVGAKSFGGAVPAYLLHDFLQKGMLTEKEYLEALNWSQSLPGPNGTNISAYLGWHFKGAWGAFLATIALLLPGTLAILLASQFLSSAPQQHVFQGILSAVAAAAVGLILGMVWNLTCRLGERIRLLVAAITFVLVGIIRIPVPLAIVFIAPIVWYLDKSKRGNDEHPV